MLQYRETLYNNYHSTQSGRAANKDLNELFAQEKNQFSNEILPIIQSHSTNPYPSIFDMGCGSGSLLKVLQDQGFAHTEGMDLSAQQVKIAEKFEVKNVKLGDALEFLKHNKSKYDIILGMDIIEHFTKDELVQLLHLIKENLTIGGMALFRTPNLDAPIATAFANGDFTHENYLNASSAEQVGLACGFSQVYVMESFMKINHPLKEAIRKLLFFLLKSAFKLTLFATARSSKNVLTSPNLIIKMIK